MEEREADNTPEWKKFYPGPALSVEFDRHPYGFKRCLLEVFRFHSGLQRSLKNFEDKVCGVCGVLYGPMGTGVSSILRLG